MGYFEISIVGLASSPADKKTEKMLMSLNRHSSRIFFSFFPTLVYFFNLPAQTCCSGGVPLSSNLGLPASHARALQFSLNYDLNELNTLKEGTKKLDNPGSSRRTHTIMLQAGYAFSDRFSVDAFLPYVRPERTSADFEYSTGVGDLAILFKYNILAKNKNNTVLTGALGLEFPTGSYEEVSNIPSRQSFPLSADMQPGSGSFDGIVWAQFTQVTGFRPSMSFLAQGMYKYNGKNDNYDDGERPYQFGPEFQILAGLSDRITTGNLLFDPALIVKFRKSFTDKTATNGVWTELPASGGKFVFLNPSLTYWINPSFSLNVNVEVPVYANVTLSQVSPTYRLNAGIFYKFEFKNNKIETFIKD